MNQCDRVRDYFVNRYPDRSSLLAQLGFRGRHNQATVFLQTLDLSVRGRSLLDYGCGDGVLLASLLGSRPAQELESLSVTLEDIAERALANARAQLAPLAISAETVLISPETSHQTQYGIVLAVGVLDYYHDWMARAAELAARTKERFVFTMPRRRWTTHALRRLWLAAHGIRIWRASDRDLRALRHTIGGQWLVERDRSTYYCAVDLRDRSSLTHSDLRASE